MRECKHMRIQSWPIDLYFLYAVSGLITIIVSAILFNRVWHTKRKSQIDKDYCYLLVFFAVFGLVDAVWGFLGSPVASPVPNPDAYNVFTYFFHTMAGLSAFVWTVYIIRYLKLKARIRVIALIVCVLFLMTQAALIIQNMFTGNAFGVAADGDAAGHIAIVVENGREDIRLQVWATSERQPIADHQISVTVTLVRRDKITAQKIEGSQRLDGEARAGNVKRAIRADGEDAVVGDIR